MIYRKKSKLNLKKIIVSILLLIQIFLTSCATKTVSSCNIPLQRLTVIKIDCYNKTYGDCIIDYDNALKQSNQDKKKILESMNKIK